MRHRQLALTGALTLIGALALMAIVARVTDALRQPRPTARLPLQVRLVGFTNGVPGALCSSLRTNYATLIRDWNASGARVAVFRITNRQWRPIILYPSIGFFDSTNAVFPRYTTVLLNAPTAHGIFLRPGQGTLARVAVLPREGPGRAKFGYTLDYYHFLPRTIEQARGFLTRKPAIFQTEWVESDVIDP
jgi:hypothetical protein